MTDSAQFPQLPFSCCTTYSFFQLSRFGTFGTIVPGQWKTSGRHRPQLQGRGGRRDGGRGPALRALEEEVQPSPVISELARHRGG